MSLYYLTPTVFAGCNGSEIMISSAGIVRYSHNADEPDLYSVGTVATFTCEGGYELMGNSTIRCKLGGWSDDNPTCVAKLSGKSEACFAHC